MTVVKRTKRSDAVKQGRAMSKRKFPTHLSMETPEEWRALKRTQWREVTQALERFNYGSAYTPAHSPQWEIHRLVAQVTEAIEADGWIAW